LQAGQFLESVTPGYEPPVEQYCFNQLATIYSWQRGLLAGTRGSDSSMLPFKLVYNDDYYLPIGAHIFPAEKYRRIRDRLLRSSRDQHIFRRTNRDQPMRLLILLGMIACFGGKTSC
jgi:hypothetical protein